MKFTKQILSALLFVAPAAAYASEGDWFASLYTGEGIELRADDRVFTLFSVLNAMGYDAAPMTRQFPLPRYQFHPVREQVRNKLLSAPTEVRSQANAFFDAHPVGVDRYLAYALSTSAPPFANAPKSKELQGRRRSRGAPQDRPQPVEARRPPRGDPVRVPQGAPRLPHRAGRAARPGAEDPQGGQARAVAARREPPRRAGFGSRGAERDRGGARGRSVGDAERRVDRA